MIIKCVTDCCPELEVKEDIVIIKDDYQNQVTMTKEQFLELLRNFKDYIIEHKLNEIEEIV